MRYTVQLNRQEMDRCRAELARIKQELAGYKSTYTVGNLDRNVLSGAGAELAASILFGTEFKGYQLKRRKEGDTGSIEVRSTEKPNYNLRVNVDDDFEKPFVFIIHRRDESPGLFEFMGWHFGWFVRDNGKEILQKHDQPDGSVRERPFWWVKNELLRPMDEVICIARGWPVEKSVRGYAELMREKKEIAG